MTWEGGGRLYEPILSKQQFVREYQKGTFGNRAPTWQSLFEFLASDYNGLVHIRNRVAGGPTWYDVKAEDVENVCKTLQLDLNSYYFSGMAPTEKTLIQGEVMQSDKGLYFYYSRIKKPMRDSLKEGGKEAFGLVARSLLFCAMDPVSWDWLNVLLERYTNHVIEVSVYDCWWGTIPNRNCIVWEVRKY